MIPAFLGLGILRWMLILVAMLTLLLLGDAAAGHSRLRFHRKIMWTPFVVGALLLATSASTAALPGSEASLVALRVAGWLAVVAGIAGAVAHHVFGVVRQPAGYSWLLHYLMYGAPALAPMGLSSLGLLAIVIARRIEGAPALLGLHVAPVVLIVVAVTLLGLVAQTLVLHYRGAFNNPAMYLPATAPVLAAVATPAVLLTGSSLLFDILVVLLWATFIVGFIGLGMHLRGFDRMMGGLYTPRFALWEGPPAWAPAQYAGFAALGLFSLPLL